jgi:hypothetical protein
MNTLAECVQEKGQKATEGLLPLIQRKRVRNL